MKITSAILLFSFALLIIGRNFSAWTLFETVPFNLKYISYIDQAPQLWETVMLQLNPIVFSLPPMMLGLMLALWGFVFFNKKISSSEKLLITAANMFFIFYITAAILSDTLVTIRYGIMLYPFAAILAAIGASRLIRICSAAVPSQRSISIAVSGLIVAGYVMSLVSIRPYYFNYTSSLLPSDAVIADSWGYGGYEAAQYLNSLPDAEHQLETVADDRARLGPDDASLLIVEDDPHYARILADLARDSGFKVLIAHRGADALSLAKKHRPSATITSNILASTPV